MDTVETGHGKQSFGGVTMSDAKEGGYGTITVEDVFEKSSNVGAAKLIEKQFGTKPRKIRGVFAEIWFEHPTGFSDGTAKRNLILKNQPTEAGAAPPFRG